MVILDAEEGQNVKLNFASISFPFVQPLARVADRMLPFVSFRLAAALRIQRRQTAESEFRSLDWWTHVLSVSSLCLFLGMIGALCLHDGVWLILGLVCAAGYPIMRYQRELGAAEAIRTRSWSSPVSVDRFQLELDCSGRTVHEESFHLCALPS